MSDTPTPMDELEFREIAINEDKLLELCHQVRLVAAESPLFRYEAGRNGCQYKPDEDNPQGCIIGAAVRRMGCTELDAGAPTIVELCSNWNVSDHLYDITWWLGNVQSQQDGGEPWGECVREADTDWQGEGDPPAPLTAEERAEAEARAQASQEDQS